MHNTKMKPAIFRLRFDWLLVSAVFALLLSCARPGVAQQSEPKTFASPEEACHALFQAAQNNDDQTLANILGAGKVLTASSDEDEDKIDREGFVEKYREMHHLVQEPDKITVLYIGAENRSFPVPLVSRNGVWRFDSETGMDEAVFRRIRTNEAMVIGAFRLLDLAQAEYYAKPHGNDSIHEYAMRFSGTPESDGLYSAGNSPVPVRLAKAANDGLAAHDTSAVSFHGYYFRVLTSQGKSAPGGAKSYFANGRMTGGFAFIAWPAEYRSSGAMTFIGGADGTVYEKELGPKTTEIAGSMTQYNPDSTWHAAEQ